ncbi:hypothetical protein WMY93_027224 [Mugilogobius chulae]|uniref:Uncharacterized protein n=1 Tax=Mugilogobius chulae TaxID=88201 RepID=A0AAW0MU29_9GOBI
MLELQVVQVKAGASGGAGQMLELQGAANAEQVVQVNAGAQVVQVKRWSFRWSRSNAGASGGAGQRWSSGSRSNAGASGGAGQTLELQVVQLVAVPDPVCGKARSCVVTAEVLVCVVTAGTSRVDYLNVARGQNSSLSRIDRERSAEKLVRLKLKQLDMDNLLNMDFEDFQAWLDAGGDYIRPAAVAPVVHPDGAGGDAGDHFVAPVAPPPVAPAVPVAPPPVAPAVPVVPPHVAPVVPPHVAPVAPVVPPHVALWLLWNILVVVVGTQVSGANKTANVAQFTPSQ